MLPPDQQAALREAIAVAESARQRLVAQFVEASDMGVDV